MTDNYSIKPDEVNGKPFLKVFLNDQQQIDPVQELLNGLGSARKANVTDSQHGSEKRTLSVYPVPTSSIEGLESEVRQALKDYFQ